MRTLQALLVASVLAVVGSYVLFAQQGGSQMSFFITSTGVGDGANLGGLAGADKHCQTLAAAAGAGNRTWRAYLSTQGAGAVNARDRIGKGPWTNAKGVRRRQERRRPAQCEQQPDQGNAADRKRRGS